MSNNANLPAMDERMKARLTCPISLEHMKDPVLLVQSGQTFDRKSLCKCLLQWPTKCPKTGQNFDGKLVYIDDYNTQEDLTYYLGEDAFQKFDDFTFQWEYNALWTKDYSETCKEVAALICGMNRRQVNMLAAQEVLTTANAEDPVLMGFKALLLHPEAFKGSELHKDEAEALHSWR
jgi:hypothetical protein